MNERALKKAKSEVKIKTQRNSRNRMEKILQSAQVKCDASPGKESEIKEKDTFDCILQHKCNLIVIQLLTCDVERGISINFLFP